eukprot:6698293-Pyramimonas_sp.AAC.1
MRGKRSQSRAPWRWAADGLEKWLRNLPEPVLQVSGGKGARAASLSPFSPLGLLGGRRRRRWSCSEILVSIRPRRGRASGGIGASCIPGKA